MEGKCSGQEGADVLAETVRHRDRESRIGRDVEVSSSLVALAHIAAVEGYSARAGGDVHAFRGTGLEMILAGMDESQGHFLTIRSSERVGDNFSLKVDIGNGGSGDVFESHGFGEALLFRRRGPCQ